MPDARGRRMQACLAIGVATAAFWWLLLLDVPYFFAGPSRCSVATDFRNYYVAAEIGTGAGWAHIYDVGLQARLYEALGACAAGSFSQVTQFISPPVVAWLVSPLVPLGFPIASWTWIAVLALAAVFAFVVAAPGNRLVRSAAVLVALGAYPTMFAISFGQVSVLVAAGVALGLLLLGRNHPVAAGATLAIACVLKPQDALLVVLAVAVAAPRSALLAFAGVGAVLGALSAASIGLGGLAHYAALVEGERGLPGNVVLTLAGVLPPAAAALLELVCALMAASVVWMQRRATHVAFAAALLGSILASPYLHPGDFVVIVLAALLYLRARGGAWRWGGLGAGAVTVELVARTQLPFIAFELAWLAIMFVEAVLVARRRAERSPAGATEHRRPLSAR